MVIRVSLSATPYLLRLNEWDVASQMLEAALKRDHSVMTAQAALPAHAADVGALDLFGQCEEGFGIGQGGIDALLIQIVVGDDGKARAFERCAQAGGEGIKVTSV